MSLYYNDDSIRITILPPDEQDEKWFGYAYSEDDEDMAEHARGRGEDIGTCAEAIERALGDYLRHKVKAKGV